MKFKSALVTQVSGSVGGMTGSHNKGGMYFRARSIPTNPQSAFQVAIRNAMAGLVVDWSAVLSAAQRAAWDTYAANVPVVNALGDTINLSGQQQYIRSNVPRAQAGLTAIDDAPTAFNLGEFTDPSFSIDTANDEVDVTFDNTDAWANEDDSSMIVFASRPQSAGINFFKGPYRLAGTIDGNSTTAPTSPAAIALPFPITAGNKIFFQVRVSRADGRLSSPFRGVSLAT